MKFQEMKPGIAYNVTKKSTDGTFQVGDVIAIVPKDKSILLMGAGGWITLIIWIFLRSLISSARWTRNITSGRIRLEPGSKKFLALVPPGFLGTISWMLSLKSRKMWCFLKT